MKTWRARICKAIWGDGSKLRCQELVFSLLNRGHGCDPAQATVCRVLKAARRLLIKHPQCWQTYVESWEQRSVQAGNRQSPVYGPVGQIYLGPSEC